MSRKCAKNDFYDHSTLQATPTNRMCDVSRTQRNHNTSSWIMLSVNFGWSAPQILPEERGLVSSVSARDCTVNDDCACNELCRNFIGQVFVSILRSTDLQNHLLIRTPSNGVHSERACIHGRETKYHVACDPFWPSKSSVKFQRNDESCYIWTSFLSSLLVLLIILTCMIIASVLIAWLRFPA
jgi:hypothetical protein